MDEPAREEGGVVGDQGESDPSNSDLERRKLQLEIIELRHWYLRAPFLSALLTAGATLFILFYSGFFDAKRALLQLERAGIQHEIDLLNEKKDDLHVQNAALGSQVAQLQKERDKLTALFHSASFESQKSKKDLGSCLVQLENVKNIIQAGNQLAAARQPDNSPPGPFWSLLPDEPRSSLTLGTEAAGETAIRERADHWRQLISGVPPYRISGETQDSYVLIPVADPRDYWGLRRVLTSLGYIPVKGFESPAPTQAVRPTYLCRIGPMAKTDARKFSILSSVVEGIRLESVTR